MTTKQLIKQIARISTNYVDVMYVDITHQLDVKTGKERFDTTVFYKFDDDTTNFTIYAEDGVGSIDGLLDMVRGKLKMISTKEKIVLEIEQATT